VALYRKYRPMNFKEIVGQRAIVTTLENQIKSGKIGHAYLFCGMRGTGKTSTARVFAKALNCENGPTTEPCNECPSCKAINNGSMMDVIEMDAASNRGIDDIRDLREKVNFSPSDGRYKIYIIDEVHMLTTEAFNALLKTLEEPPQHVVFILATTDPVKLPSTILSRCMRFDFKRVPSKDIIGRMKEIINEYKIDAEEKALQLIAISSQGSMRDALSLLDKALAYGAGTLAYEDLLNLLGATNHRIFYDISKAVEKKDFEQIMNIIEDICEQGKDLSRFISDLLVHYRNLLLISLGTQRCLIDVVDEEYKALQEIVQNYSRERLLSIIDILKDGANDIKWSAEPRIVLESTLTKLALPQLWEEKQHYISRIQELEKTVNELQEKLDKIILTESNIPVNETIAKNQQSKEQNNGNNVKIVEKLLESKEPKDTKGEELNPDKSNITEQPEQQNNLENLQQEWENILDDLSKKGKMILANFIKVAKVEPLKLDNNQLILSYNGVEAYKKQILSEKQILEDTIKRITGMQVIIKGLESNSDKKKESAQKPEEKFGEQVIKFFGEDIVQIEE
jgi:DNA polymerase-3 subunit gamma/tau